MFLRGNPERFPNVGYIHCKSEYTFESTLNATARESIYNIYKKK